MKKLISLMLILMLIVPAFAMAESTIIEAEDPTLYFITREVEVGGCSYSDILPLFQKIEENTGIKITWETVPTDYNTVMSTRVAAMTDLPDFMNNPGLSINALATGGIAARLNELIDAYAPNIAARLASQPATMQELTAPDGGLYVLPNIMGIENYCTNPMTFIIRFDWLEKCGIAAAPTTMEEWYTTLTAFVEQDPNGNGEQDETPFCANTGAFMKSFATAYGLDNQSDWNVDENGKVFFQWTSEAARDWLTEMNKWYAEGLIAADYLTNRNIDSRHLEDQTGASYMWSASNADWQNINNTISTPDWRPILPPKNVYTGEDGSVYVAASNLYGAPSVITNANGKAELAVKWFNYLWSDEGSIMTGMGIEGETFYWDENGEARYIAEFVDGSNWYQNTKAYGIDPGALPRVYTMYFSKAQAADWSDIVNEAAAAVVPYVRVSMPKYVASADEEMIMDMIWGDINTYVTEMLDKFIVGSEPLENFDTFVAQVEKMGLADVLAIKQAQYDRANA